MADNALLDAKFRCDFQRINAGILQCINVCYILNENSFIFLFYIVFPIQDYKFPHIEIKIISFSKLFFYVKSFNDIESNQFF